MDKKRPQFSVIIPTRERHETLYYSMQTVLCQDFDDFELIICDNCSSNETKNVVKGFISDRIKYIRSDVPLAMHDNWELALSTASGDYVIMLGDDDGLIKGALSYLHSIIQKTSYKLIRWERIYYSWPNMEPTVFANQLTIPFNRPTQMHNGEVLIRRIIDFENEDYTQLPMLYNSVVHRSVIENVKKSHGRFFHSIIPDVFSGYVLAYTAETFLSLGFPLSINGGSAKSNGASFMFKPHDQVITNDFNALNEKSEINFDESIPYIRSIITSYIEPFVKFKKIFQIEDISIDRGKFFSKIIKDVRVYNELEKEIAIKKILNVADTDSSLSKIVRQLVSNITIKEIDNIGKYKIGLSGNNLILNASLFGIWDVSAVSDFVANFYDFNDSTLKNIEPELHNTYNGSALFNRIKTAGRIIIYGKQ